MQTHGTALIFTTMRSSCVGEPLLLVLYMWCLSATLVSPGAAAEANTTLYPRTCHLRLRTVMSHQLCILGNGANMAIRDAWSLAEELVKPSHATLADAVAAYDAESMPRSKQALESGRWC